MMQRVSKLAGIMLVISLVLVLPFAAEAGGQFTVEFNADGTVSRVFQGSITSLLGDEVTPRPESEGAVAHHMRGKWVNNVTSVTIVTSADDPCIISAGKAWCW